MTDANKKTVAAYSNNVNAYHQSTPQSLEAFSPAMREWIDTGLKAIRPGSKILEIGSATLRDATYMRKHGFAVTVTDAAQGFIENLRGNGENAQHFNVLTDPIPQGYSMVFANAVVPHFTKEDFGLVLKKVRQALLPGGIFAFSAKLGEGHEWIKEKFSEKRYINYWGKAELIQLVEDCGYTVPFVNTNKGPYPSHNWINVLAKIPE